MRLRNNIFAEAIRWLKKNIEGIKYQKDIAARIGCSEDTITRILHDQTEVTDDFLCRFNEAFNDVFNYQWLRGEDPNCMLAEDIEYYRQHPGERMTFAKPHESAKQDSPVLPSDTLIMSKMYESMIKPIESAHTQVVNSLNQQLKDKQSIIELQADKIKSQADEIAKLKKVISDLHASLSAGTFDEILKHHPFPFGVADRDSLIDDLRV